MKTLILTLALTCTALTAHAGSVPTPAPRTAAPGGRLVIGGVPMVETAANYHRTIKYLTVPASRQSQPAFAGTDTAAVRALENPLRRQIFDAMNQNRAEVFRFATLRQAQENFTMRVQAVQFMVLMRKGRASGGIDFDYSGPKPDGIEVAQAADPGHWVHLATYFHASRRGVSASAAVDGIVRQPYRGECLGAMQINVLHAARLALGAARFDRLHPTGLSIGAKGNSTAVHFRPATSLDPRDMVPGDWVYIKNKDDYNSDLRPGVALGLWQGENAMYLGRYDALSKGVPVFKPTAGQRFSGMGAYDKTEAGMRKELKTAYVNLMTNPSCTFHRHAITDADIRWTRVDRLVTEP